ncbi:hypothetical protein [Microbacterium sp. NIBRBAC000506063]|uniref:hypothetical protein n=1 Tax=Microbacterium sp. NIBRBAC000506063 TaxID=2734618 RepID=UPI0039813289
MTRAPEDVTTSAETADLLEALRRRRGQRESAPSHEENDTQEHSPIALFEALEDDEPDAPEPEPGPELADASSARKRRRNAMPSWDEIVFGARTDD